MDLSSSRLDSPVDIGSIHFRSQDVVPGGLFVAIPGFRSDGHDFIQDAVEKGASAIISQRPYDTELPLVQVEDARIALAQIASTFFDNPSEKLFVIGVTGTNGKTTTACLIEGILKTAGFNTGVIGTLNYRFNEKTFETPMTTPESLDLQRILKTMADEGVTHVVMEVSSHAVDLNRIYACKFDIGVFTNFSQDHLDYHLDMDAYWECKKSFFTDYLVKYAGKTETFAVVNCDNEKGKELLQLSHLNCIPTGLHELSAVTPENIESDITGTRAKIQTTAGSIHIASPLVGAHNLENILNAAGVGIAMGIDPAVIQTGIESVPAIPGRLEAVANNSGRFIFVDYAHTPDALEKVLLALKPLCIGRLVSLLGCGGDRDKRKRPLMGKISGEIADLSIITSDNPRTEDPMTIIREILTGIKGLSLRQYSISSVSEHFEDKGYVVVPDRKEAIALGISASQPGDTLLIAGKGHETYQILGTERVPFDDREEARKALKA